MKKVVTAVLTALLLCFTAVPVLAAAPAEQTMLASIKEPGAEEEDRGGKQDKMITKPGTSSSSSQSNNNKIENAKDSSGKTDSKKGSSSTTDSNDKNQTDKNSDDKNSNDKNSNDKDSSNQKHSDQNDSDDHESGKPSNKSGRVAGLGLGTFFRFTRLLTIY